MTLDPDAIVDRRRMRRKLTFWRVGAVLIAVAAIATAGFATVSSSSWMDTGSGYIARIKITGLIRGNDDRTEALEKLSKSSAKAVILHLDSPGGTTAGSEQLYDSLRRLQDKKPVVVVIDGLAASGAYIAAISAEHVIALDTSLVGSIGVLFQYPNFTELLKTVGVNVESIKSSPLKAAPARAIRAMTPALTRQMVRLRRMRRRSTMASASSDMLRSFNGIVGQLYPLDAGFAWSWGGVSTK